MTVADNIGYGLKIRGVGRQERTARVAELVALTNIAGLEHRRIGQLSGGQRQRVALARAVAIRPGVLLLDEPLTALDAALRDRLRGELNRLLRALGITAIYVTHDQSEAMELGDRIVVMQREKSLKSARRARFIFGRPAASLRNSSEPPISSKRRSKMPIWCWRADDSRLRRLQA